MLERWRGGSIKLIDEQEARGRVLVCEDIAGLSLASIQAFYGIEPKTEARKP